MPGSREESPVQANMLPKYCKVSLGEKMVKRILYFVVKRLNANRSQEQAACRRDCKVQESECFLTFEKRGSFPDIQRVSSEIWICCHPSSTLVQNSEALRAN